MQPPSESPARLRPAAKLLHTESFPFEQPLTKLDLRALQAGFSALFDAAAVAVRRAGYDLDDVVLERIMVCEDPDGTPFDVAAEPLSDRDELIRRVVRSASHLDGGSDQDSAESICVRRLMVHALLDA